MTKPFFSIITCVYNSEKFLTKNLESVTKQTFKDYEHIIVYSKSKDNSRKIINNYLKTNSKAAVVSTKPNGVASAFNKGIKHSKGKYLFFLNSDDYFYDKNVLMNTNEFLRDNSNLDWVYGVINVVEENRQSIGIFPSRKMFQIGSKYLLKFFNYIPHQAVFMKKEVFNKFGKFDVSLKTNMDYDYWLRVSRKSSWKFYNAVVTSYCVRGDAVSSSSDSKHENLKCMETVQSKHLNRFEMIAAKIVNRLVMKVNKTYR